MDITSPTSISAKTPYSQQGQSVVRDRGRSFVLHRAEKTVDIFVAKILAVRVATKEHSELSANSVILVQGDFAQIALHCDCINNLSNSHDKTYLSPKSSS
jgi:hypothetical protein